MARTRHTHESESPPRIIDGWEYCRCGMSRRAKDETRGPWLSELPEFYGETFHLQKRIEKAEQA